MTLTPGINKTKAIEKFIGNQSLGGSVLSMKRSYVESEENNGQI